MKVIINIKGKEEELSLSEAKELFDELRELFELPHNYPIGPPSYPDYKATYSPKTVYQDSFWEDIQYKVVYPYPGVSTVTGVEPPYWQRPPYTYGGEV